MNNTFRYKTGSRCFVLLMILFQINFNVKLNQGASALEILHASIDQSSIIIQRDLREIILNT